MPTNDTTPTIEDDAPTTNNDPAGGERPELKTTVDVRVPTEIADVVAQRAARRSTHEGAVTAATITGLADDYVSTWTRQRERKAAIASEPWVPSRPGRHVAGRTETRG